MSQPLRKSSFVFQHTWALLVPCCSLSSAFHLPNHQDADISENTVRGIAQRRDSGTNFPNPYLVSETPCSILLAQIVHCGSASVGSEKSSVKDSMALFYPVLSKFIWLGNLTSLLVKSHPKILAPQNLYFKGQILGLSAYLWHWGVVGGRQGRGWRVSLKVNNRKINPEED